MPFSSEISAGLLHDEPLAKYTAARLGGPADLLYVARRSLDELREVVTTAWNEAIPVLILGGGANVLMSDKGFRGLVVVNDVTGITFEGHTSEDGPSEDGPVHALSGTSLSIVARKCQSRGLAGFEWAVSVPGTVGGAVVNNAGAHGGDMAGCVREVGLLDAADGQKTLSLADLEYSYRMSSLKARTDRRFLVLWTELTLAADDPEAIQTRMDSFIAHRKRTQPPGASLGSIFKNPPGDFAGRLIESAGLKGYQIGGAQVSPVHANFFINTGKASASDYYALIRHVQAEVQRQSGVSLEMEVETGGEWGNG